MTSLFYNPNTPISTESFAQWQENFIQNFTQSNNAFSQDHVPLDAASNAGNHNVIELLKRKSTQQTGVAELSLYSKNVVNQTDQIFMNIQGSEFQYSNYQIYALPTTNTYFTFLPGGLIVYFGLSDYKTAPGSGSFKNLVLVPAIAKNVISVNFTQAVPNTIATKEV